jgi:lactoylglutathione lyase
MSEEFRGSHDVGLTHVALPVTDLAASAEFYAKYARMKIVHRRARATELDRSIAWLSDLTRPFALVLAETEEVATPLGPFAHLGVACATRGELDRLAQLARAEGCLREGPWESGGPAGYLCMLSDPDGHTLELSYGQEIALAVEQAG